MPKYNTELELEHAQMVKNLSKPGADVLVTITSERAHLWHMATGVAGEGGELLDAIKKAVVYNKQLDVANVIEELGDLEFYMEGLRDALGITREETLASNMRKLLKGRYQSGIYTDKDAQQRADKLDNLIGENLSDKDVKN